MMLFSYNILGIILFLSPIQEVNCFTCTNTIASFPSSIQKYSNSLLAPYRPQQYSHSHVRIKTSFENNPKIFKAIQSTSCEEGSSESIPTIAPIIRPEIIEQVNDYVSRAFGDDANDDMDDNENDRNPNDKHFDRNILYKTKDERYASARRAASEVMKNSSPSELVYGELSIPVLARLLNAVGVYPNERILDVGSGDGGLVLGASMLLSEHKNAFVQKVVGLEIVPGLYHRSIKHGKRFQTLIQQTNECSTHLTEFEFVLGDIYQSHSDAKLRSLLHDTTLVICFATTWSARNANDHVHVNDGADAPTSTSKTSLKKRILPKLSSALSFLPKGGRAIIVDGKLSCSQDGFQWNGDLKIQCPDTAPYSIASLYEKI